MEVKKIGKITKDDMKKAFEVYVKIANIKCEGDLNMFGAFGLGDIKTKYVMMMEKDSKLKAQFVRSVGWDKFFTKNYTQNISFSEEFDKMMEDNDVNCRVLSIAMMKKAYKTYPTSHEECVFRAESLCRTVKSESESITSSIHLLLDYFDIENGVVSLKLNVEIGKLNEYRAATAIINERLKRVQEFGNDYNDYHSYRNYIQGHAKLIISSLNAQGYYKAIALDDFVISMISIVNGIPVFDDLYQINAGSESKFSMSLDTMSKIQEAYFNRAGESGIGGIFDSRSFGDE